jgi:uncharacterized membrane protein HdeD (DUF308 family)
MRLVFAILWLAVGAYCLYRPMSSRAYLKQLPDSPGNRSLKRPQAYLFIFGIAALAIGIWHLVMFFRADH